MYLFERTGGRARAIVDTNNTTIKDINSRSGQIRQAQITLSRIGNSFMIRQNVNREWWIKHL